MAEQDSITAGPGFDTFQKALGQFLAAECEGATAWVLSGNAELARHLGLRATIKMPVKNGAIDCRWLCYELDGPAA